MKTDENALTNHEITICLRGGAVLGPFMATWSKDSTGDIRDLARDFDAYLQGTHQTKYKYHLHDSKRNVSHTLIVQFENVTAIYDQVGLH